VVEANAGIVEDSLMTSTFLRAYDDSRIVIPNEKLASDTIRNATIVDRMQRAEITLQVPLSTDLENVIKLLRDECSGEREAEAIVSGLDGTRTITGRERGRAVGGRPRRRRRHHGARARPRPPGRRDARAGPTRARAAQPA